MMASAAAEAERAVPSDGRRGTGETILIVDDEEAIRSVLTRLLERSGYRVLPAADGAEAVAIYAARGGEIALVVTDVSMPRMSGMQLVVALRALNPEVRIIANSGRMSRLQADELRALGVVDVIAKPYSREELLATVEAALHRSS
jgi:CheY-like chemotaxis protein